MFFLLRGALSKLASRYTGPFILARTQHYKQDRNESHSKGPSVMNIPINCATVRARPLKAGVRKDHLSPSSRSSMAYEIDRKPKYTRRNHEPIMDSLPSIRPLTNINRPTIIPKMVRILLQIGISSCISDGDRPNHLLTTE